eukprot:CAMPEP_0183756182 /NCGR_PEP_ID=MMETSP0739-20130205/4837_1 /TAXON_ID=385413 /ORGANISM="Thalassiosira miniscula, Strain CCMP1093" /LENGTH=189 /DNA_ID=CAMNT_0025993297 /DNA_START=24 /DNA_END=590 /DNA_ORIENTATION=+
MKNCFLATAVALLPAASHAFIASVKPQTSPVQSSSSLFQQYYDQGGQYYDDGSNQQYYDQEQQPAYYDQGQQQQQYYDQDPAQQQYYDQQQMQQQEESALLITDNMQQEMARATAGVDVPIDVLALARQRAAERRPSNNVQSTDADWFTLAEEKKRQKAEIGQYGDDDEDWEKSLEDEGSMNDAAAMGV